MEINVNNFQERKRIMLNKLEEAKRKNEVDKDIIPHIDIMNSWPFVFTTSSCSGRIALIDAPFVGPKKESEKAFRWHSKVDPARVLGAIREYTPRNVLWLKFDSFILAFSVSSLKWAKFFLNLARFINLKDSGIRSINPNAGYINMDFMSTEKLSLPVKISNHIMLSEEDLTKIIQIANFLMDKNKIKLKLLYDILVILDRWIKEGNMFPPALDLFDDAIKVYRRELEVLKEKFIQLSKALTG